MPMVWVFLLCCVRPQTAAGRSIDSDGAGGACDDDIHGKHRGARFWKGSEAKQSHAHSCLLSFVRSSVLWMLLLMVGLMSRAHARTNHAITPTERTEARTGLCWAGGHMAAGCRRVARLGQSWHGRTLPLPCSVHDPWPCRAVLCCGSILPQLPRSACAVGLRLTQLPRPSRFCHHGCHCQHC